MTEKDAAQQKLQRLAEADKMLYIITFWPKTFK